MGDSVMFHDGNRRLQDQFDSRRISDRLEEKLTRQAFTDQDRAFIEQSMFFFLATADAEGRPDCSFKGGAPGGLWKWPPPTTGVSTGLPFSSMEKPSASPTTYIGN